jgi:hypothetical protein
VKRQRATERGANRRRDGFMSGNRQRNTSARGKGSEEGNQGFHTGRGKK